MSKGLSHFILHKLSPGDSFRFMVAFKIYTISTSVKGRLFGAEAKAFTVVMLNLAKLGPGPDKSYS